MYLTLSYQLKNKVVNSQLSILGSAIVFSGAVNYYFTNPIVAFKVKQYLSKRMKNYNYKIIQMPEELTQKKTYIKSYQDFLDYVEEKKTENTSKHEELQK